MKYQGFIKYLGLIRRDFLSTQSDIQIKQQNFRNTKEDNMENEPFILAELDDLSSLFAPLKSATRIKYTCFNVSANLLIVGASSGGLYVFRREPCVFLQLLPSKEGAVSQISISADERLIGVATVRGTVSLVERNQRGSRIVATSFEHAGCAVTALTWGVGELYIGDAEGRVSVLARTVFQPPAALLMQLDSRIIQLDSSAGLLLVSTNTRSYVCDTERELYKQVGQKLRDGPFGGCFLSSEPSYDFSEYQPAERTRGVFSDIDKDHLDYTHLRHVRVFCTRPGARIWEADVEGTVLRTHHFKQDLSTPPRPITSDNIIDNNNQILSKNSEQSSNFGRLFVLLTRYLLTYTSDALFVIDPQNSTVVLWCNQLSDIIDLRVTSNVIYVWCSSGKIHALNIVPLEKFLIRMYFWKKYQIVANLCLEFSQYLKSHAPNSSKIFLLKDLDEKLNEQDAPPSLITSLAPILEIFKNHAQNAQIHTAHKLQSGIYQITRPSYLNLKNRSQSVSPDRHSKQSKGSTSSLPELVMEEEELVDESYFVDGKIKSEIIEFSAKISKDSTEDMQQIINQLIKLSCKENELIIRTLPLRTIFSKDVLKVIVNSFKFIMNSSNIEDFLKNIELSDLKISHPEFLVNTFSSEVLIVDFKLSCLLKLFGNIMDEDRIMDDLKRILPNCYYLCLTEVVSRFEADSMNLTETLSPPRFLNVVLFLLKVGQVDQITRWSHKLDLKDIMYLTLSREMQDGRAARVTFLSILDGWKCGSSSWLPLEPFVVHCMSAVEEASSCECGFPLPSKNKPKNFRFSNFGGKLLEMKSSDGAAAVRLCGVAPWLWPQWLRLRASDDLLTLLPLILHLGNLQELERRLPEMSDLVCEVTVRHLAGLYRGDCLNCGRKLPVPVDIGVTWTQAALLLVKAVGHAQTLNLLKQYKGDISKLDPIFHKAVVLSAIMEKHSNGLRYGVVDVLAGRTPQTSLMSPSLQAEIFAITPATPSTPIPDDTHWGLKLNVRTTCPVCSLQLGAKVLTDAGIIAFRCQHAFHAVCLRKSDTCPCCANKETRL